jgi:hypothetical protein
LSPRADFSRQYRSSSPENRSGLGKMMAFVGTTEFVP